MRIVVNDCYKYFTVEAEVGVLPVMCLGWNGVATRFPHLKVELCGPGRGPSVLGIGIRWRRTTMNTKIPMRLIDRMRFGITLVYAVLLAPAFLSEVCEKTNLEIH